MRKFLVCDLQFGSTGKGAIAYHLAKHNALTTAVAAYTPNAGHTAVDGEKRFVHMALPIAAAVDTVRNVLIGPGAVFSADRVVAEAAEIRRLVPEAWELGPRTIHMHPAAVPVMPADQHAEREFVAIGSTMKGTAAANWRRMQRSNRPTIGERPETLEPLMEALAAHDWHLRCERDSYMQQLYAADRVIVEGAQGFSLSVYHGFYPHVTSRDTTPNQIAADCGLGARYSEEYNIVGSLRTYPIRVANRFDGNGKQVGWSGPFYEDGPELAWSDLGREPELTTVTRLPRRIAEFSFDQLYDALEVCQPHSVFLNFCNYVRNADEISRICEYVHQHGSEVRWLGYGADDADIFHAGDSEGGTHD